MGAVTPNRIDSERNKRRGLKILLVILILLLLFLLSLSIWMLFFRTPELAPDYAPPDEDPYATDIEGDDGKKLDVPEGGGAIGMTYRDTITIDLSDRRGYLLYQNPRRSNSDVIVQVVVRGVVVAQSGRVEPGKQITMVDLLPGAAKMLQKGGYDANIAVYFYDPVTAERALLQTQGEVEVTVVE